MGDLNEALWAGALAVIKGLPRETGGVSRHPGEFSKSGDIDTVSTVFKVIQPDGSRKVYRIVVSVEETRDDYDNMWAPGGACDDVRPGERRAVIKGIAYMIASEKQRGMRGYGGRRFDIEFFDGRKVTTTNLWYQGVVPLRWRERFPDNARFATAGGEA